MLNNKTPNIKVHLVHFYDTEIHKIKLMKVLLVIAYFACFFLMLFEL